MAEADVYTKNYISQNAIFADVFNFFVFGGNQVIKPDVLRDENIEENAVVFGSVDIKDAQIVQKFRDVFKSAAIKNDGHTFYVMLGVENQSSIHNAMPVRNAIYDFLQYGKQVNKIAASHKTEGFKGMSGADFLSGFTTKDKLTPVITLVVYFGCQKWDAPLSLHQMMDLDVRLSAFVQDYKINLIEPAALSDEDLHKFATDFRQVMEFLKYSNDKRRMTELLSEGSPYANISTSAALVLNSCAGIGIKINQKEEKTNMCKAILEIKQEVREEGREEGAYEKAVATARNLLAMKILSLEQIAEATQLSLSEVAAL